MSKLRHCHIRLSRIYRCDIMFLINQFLYWVFWFLFFVERREKPLKEWTGAEWTGLERKGAERIGKEWTGKERKGEDRSG